MKKEDRIRERAYQFWRQEGCPNGKHEEHWDRAAREIERPVPGEGASSTASDVADEQGSSTPGFRPRQSEVEKRVLR
jgi:Protein of unknown function (DUF2934)